MPQGAEGHEGHTRLTIQCDQGSTMSRDTKEGPELQVRYSRKASWRKRLLSGAMHVVAAGEEIREEAG